MSGVGKFACGILVSVLALSVRAESYTWTGGDGNWTDGTKWRASGGTTGTAPGAGDDVVLPAPTEAGVTWTITAAAAIHVRDFTIGATVESSATGTVTFVSSTADFHQVDGGLIVMAGGVLTHTALANTVTTLAAVNRKLNVSVAGSALIEAGGKIDVKGRGFAQYCGPGANWGFKTGACYGGSAGNCSKHCYGSIRRPTDPGSHLGGGVVCLDVASTLIIEGEINADGGGEQCASGSILLFAADMQGGGRVHCSKTAYGSGGRIAIIQRTAETLAFTGTVDCGNGSYYLEDANDTPDRGELKVSKNACLLHSEVTDASVPFRKVTVETGGTLTIQSGVTLCCTDALTVKGTLGSAADAGTLLLSPAVGTPLAVDGTASVYGIVCTNAGAALSFASGSKLKVLDNGVLRLLGDGDSQLTLAAASQPAWTLEIGTMVDVKIEYASVSNSTATVSVADLGGVDLGGNNANWTFPRVPQIGDVITWVGGASSDWGDVANWLDPYDAHRLPVPTDRVELNAGAAHYPLVTTAKEVYDLVIAAGASLTLNGGDVTVTRDLTCAGALTCCGTETISVGRNVSFAGGTLVCGRSTFMLAGTAAQSANFAGLDIYNLDVKSPSVSFSDGFSAYGFTCEHTAPVALVFSAGDLYAATGVRLVPSGTGTLTLDSSEPGTAWRFKAGPGALCDGVSVADCDAHEGDTIRTVDFTDRKGNLNWTKGACVWLGTTSSSWTEPANWSGGVPTAENDALVRSCANAPTLTVSTCVRSLSVGGGAEAVTLTLSAELAVAETAFVGDKGTLVINSPMSVTNDFTLADGGTLTHTKNGSTQVYSLKLTVGGDMIVGPQAKIDVKGCGYAAGKGPGGGSGFRTGGVYGGRGNGCTAKPYGSIRRPTDLGSGGNSGAGGGAVCLQVNGDLTMDGTIDADGSGGDGGGGSGTGGSIWLSAAALKGAGALTCVPAYYSSGGRISVVQRTAETLAFTGTMAWDNGTCYLENAGDAPDRGELKISSSSASGLHCELATRMEDEDVPFGKVTIAAGRTLVLATGVTLCCTEALTVKGSLTSDADGGTLLLSPAVGTPLAVDGTASVYGLVCTNAGAALSFTSGSKLKVLDNGVLRLLGDGDGDGQLTLAAAEQPVWTLEVGSLVDVKVEYASVSNSTATVTIADLGGVDLGGNNANWTFPRAPQPGDVITWLGGSSDWSDVANWIDPYETHRLPVSTDRVELNAGATHYPLVTTAKEVYDLVIAVGASLTLNGGDVTVSHDLICAGTLTCGGSETISVGRNVSFAGGTLVCGRSTFMLAGTAPQSANFAGLDIYNLDVKSPSVSFSDGFSAYGFTCEHTAPVALVFSAGDLYAASSVRLVPSGTGTLTLDSSEPGTAWRFKAGPGAVCDGVSVADSDAHEGSAIRTVDFVDREGNVNWTKGACVWNGGTSSSWTDPDNWTGGVPSNTSDVVILSAVNAPTLAAPTCVRSLSVGGGATAVTLTLSAELAVAETAFVGDKGTLVINSPMSVTNDFTLANGGTLTHTKNGSTQVYSLKLTVGGDMIVGPQAMIDVKGCGYADKKGPGGGSGFRTGGAYGGRGSACTAKTYGSVRRPTDLGSGGNSGAGGGAVCLQVNGDLTMDGTIDADGSGGDGGGGSGTGGSIWLSAAALKGAGAMTCVPKYYSGGGRISIIQRTAEILAFTGTMAWDNGTCYLENALDETDRGELRISGSSLSGLASELATRMEDEDVPFGKVTIASGRTLALQKGVTLSTLTDVAGGGTLTSDADGGGLDLLASGDTTARISGDVSVFALICTNGAAAVEFAAGKTVTVRDNGTLWLDGRDVRRTALGSSVPGTQWRIVAGTNLTGKVRDLDVSDSDASGGETITAKSSAGKSPSANNLNWKFLSGFSLIVR